MTDIDSEKKMFKSSVKEIEDIEETIKTTRDRLKLLNTRKKTLQSNSFYSVDSAMSLSSTNCIQADGK